jgi:hypothetical protein
MPTIRLCRQAGAKRKNTLCAPVKFMPDTTTQKKWQILVRRPRKMYACYSLVQTWQTASLDFSTLFLRFNISRLTHSRLVCAPRVLKNLPKPHELPILCASKIYAEFLFVQTGRGAAEKHFRCSSP